MHLFGHTLKEEETPMPNLIQDPDFLEYLEEHSVPAEEKQIAFAAWLKENEDK
jgi:hypothetical protein